MSTKHKHETNVLFDPVFPYKKGNNKLIASKILELKH
jgi:hypothetical protein